MAPTPAHIVHPLRRTPAEEGAALLAVLVVVTVLTVLGGTLLAVHVAQYRFIRRDAHRLQARYAAEAGVYAAIERLEEDRRWRPRAARLGLPGERAAEVAVVPFGGYLLVRATARHGRSRCTLRALLGEVPSGPFRRAVYLWDTASSLHVAGTTRIVGDVSVGQRGIERSAFQGEGFTGRIAGRVERTPDLPPHSVALAATSETVQFLTALLATGPPGRAAGLDDGTLPLARRLPTDAAVHFTLGDLTLTPADSALLDVPATFAATGDVTVEGPLTFAPGTAFVAGERLFLVDEIDGREGLFYGREAIDVATVGRCSGQFFSAGRITVRTAAYLAYPSFLFVTGAAPETGRIAVLDDAVVDGTLVFPPLTPPPAVPAGRIVVGPDARVRGAIYNGHETELHGALFGSLVTHRLYFYESPTSYVNWLRDAVVDVTRRPTPYLLPVGLTASPRLDVLSWASHVGEPAAPAPRETTLP